MAIGANLIIGNPSLIRTGGGRISHRLRVDMVNGETFAVEFEAITRHELVADLRDSSALTTPLRITHNIGIDMSEAERARYHVWPPLTLRVDMVEGSEMGVDRITVNQLIKSNMARQSTMGVTEIRSPIRLSAEMLDASYMEGEITISPVIVSDDLSIMTVSHDTAPYMTVYRLNEGEFTPLDLPNTFPSRTWNNGFSPDGRYQAIVGNTLYLYDWVTGTPELMATPDGAPTGNVIGVSWSPDGRYLSCASTVSPYIFNFDWQSGAPVRLPDPAVLPSDDGYSVAWSPDGRYQAVGTSSIDPDITIYDWNTGEPVALPAPAVLPAGSVYGMAWSPDGRYLACGHNVSPFITIYDWDTGSPVKIANPAQLPSSTVQDIAFTADGIYMAVGGATGGVGSGTTIYDWSTGAPVAVSDFPVTGSSDGVAWSPSGELLAVALSAAPRLQIYDFTTSPATLLPSPATLPTGTAYGISWQAPIDPANAVIAAMTVAPSPERETLIRSTVNDLVAAGLWEKLDFLYVMAAHDEQASSIDWVNPLLRSKDIVNSGSLFTPDIGFSGFSLTCGDHTFADGPNSQPSNVHAGVLVLQGTTAQSTISAVIPQLNISPLMATGGAAGNTIAALYTGSLEVVATPSPGATGHYVIARDNTTNYRVHRNGGLLVVHADSQGAGEPTSTITLLGSADSDETLSIAHGGAFLSDSEVTELNTILQNYINNLGFTFIAGQYTSEFNDEVSGYFVGVQGTYVGGQSEYFETANIEHFVYDPGAGLTDEFALGIVGDVTATIANYSVVISNYGTFDLSTAFVFFNGSETVALVAHPIPFTEGETYSVNFVPT